MPGVLGVFHHEDAAVDAIGELKQNRLGNIDVYSPTISHNLENAVAAKESPVRRFTLVGGKAIASWVPYTIFGFEVMVLIGALSTVAGLFINSRIPRLTMTVGYDPRFSHGSYGVFVDAAPNEYQNAESILQRHGAVEVRRER